MSGWRSLYPFESRWFSRNGLNYHYLDEGRGEPVIFVHGNPSWSFYFRGLITELRRDHRCLALDHAGMGLSDKPGDERYRYTLEGRVADLDAWLSRVDARENLTLVVHDWGGMIGAAWAVRHPESVARLVVLNTAAFFPPKAKRLPWTLSLARSPLGPLLVQGANAFARGAARFGCARPLSRQAREGLLAPYRDWNSRRAVLRFVQDIPARPQDPSYEAVLDTQERLGRLSGKPMMLAWGLRDFVFDSDFFEEWRRRFPDAEAHAFADAGHYVLEDQGEEIARLTRDFLARHPLRGAA